MGKEGPRELFPRIKILDWIGLRNDIRHQLQHLAVFDLKISVDPLHREKSRILKECKYMSGHLFPFVLSM